jgi:hypothetical protein
LFQTHSLKILGRLAVETTVEPNSSVFATLHGLIQLFWR